MEYVFLIFDKSGDAKEMEDEDDDYEYEEDDDFFDDQSNPDSDNSGGKFKNNLNVSFYRLL